MDKLFLNKLKKQILIFFAPKLISIILKFIYFTCKKEFNISKDLKLPAIVVLWHGEMAMMPLIRVDLYKKESFSAIVSRNKDGEILSKIMQNFNIHCIRGSSSKGGQTAIKEALNAADNGDLLVITPDGPRGPRHSVSDGAILISQKKNMPIVAVNCKADKKWSFKSWDRFFIPKPFSTINIFISESFLLNDMSLEESRTYIQKRLMENAD